MASQHHFALGLVQFELLLVILIERCILFGSCRAIGIVFQVEGPNMVKLHGPHVTVREFGTHRYPFAAERRCRRPETVDIGQHKSGKYSGAVLCRHL